ncbi:MAG: plastocyanin/azurin family copper-binding protein, partial [Bacteroidota bacterium]
QLLEDPVSSARGVPFSVHTLGFGVAKPNLPEFAAAAATARETEYIPESDAVIVHTKLIGGGETTSITFDAPEAGTYDFICSFPGHYAVMQGKFIVEGGS